MWGVRPEWGFPVRGPETPTPGVRMPRPKNPVPTYSRHPHNNTARCWLNGRSVTLGRYDSPE